VLPALEGHIDDSVRARLASQQPTDPFPLTTSSTIVPSRSERSFWPSSTPSLRRRPRSFPEAGVGKRCMAKWAGTARCGRKVRSASNSGCSASWRVPSQRAASSGSSRSSDRSHHRDAKAVDDDLRTALLCGCSSAE
jgi:hypothetical protein